MGWIAWCQEQPQDKDGLDCLVPGTTPGSGWVGRPEVRKKPWDGLDCLMPGTTPAFKNNNVLGVFYTWRQQDKDNIRDFSAKQVYININQFIILFD